MVDRRERYLNDEYAERLTELLEAHPDVRESDAEDLFVRQCETFDRVLGEDATLPEIREIAFHQTAVKVRDPQGVEPSETSD